MSQLVIDLGAIDQLTARECVKAVCGCIFFHRLFGQVVPRETEVLDVTVPAADDPDLDALLDARAAAYIAAVRDASGLRSRSTFDRDRSHTNTVGGVDAAARATQPTLCIEFFEKRKNKGWFSRAEEAVCWESWHVTCTLSQPTGTARADADRTRAVASTRAALTKALWRVVQLVNRRNDEYIPSIPYGEGNPFPYQIAVLRGTT